MELDIRQNEAIEALERMHVNEGECIIKGPAGTGKSEVISAFVRKHPGVIVAAPTHKACDVLRKKGVDDPRTIHSLMYDVREEKEKVPMTDKNGDPIVDPETNEQLIEEVVIGQKWIPREEPIDDTVLFEEASMIGGMRHKDICAVTTARALIGDPFQLPPVKDKDVFNLSQANVELDKVFRIDNSPPLAFATALRQGQQATPERFEIPTLPRVRSSLEKVIESDGVVIVWKNVTRHDVNRTIRLLKGYPEWVPEIGDKIIFYETDKELGVYNGLGGYICKVFDVDPYKVRVRIMTDAGEYRTIYALAEPLQGLPCKRFGKRKEGDPLHIEYAHAITCHKAQGSEWSDVYVIDDLNSMECVTGRNAAKRWFYTAVTRTSKNLTILNGK